MQKAEKGLKPFYNQHLAFCAKFPLMVYPLVLLVGVLLTGYSLASGVPAEVRISETILTRVHYINVSFSYALDKLSIEHKLPICTEIPFSVTLPPGFKPRPGFEGKPQDETEENIPGISLDLSGKKVGEVLDTLMSAMTGKYYWVEDYGVINVIPVKSKGNKSYLLNKEVTNLTISNQTPFKAMKSLLYGVFPEYSFAGTAGGQRGLEALDPVVEGAVDIDIEKGTLRQALNAIVREHGYKWAWNPRHKDFRLLGDKFWLLMSMRVQEDHKTESGN